LAADVEGYSRLMELDEAGTLRTLTSFRGILHRLIGQHGGRIANTAGDSVLAEFPSAVDAVQCTVTIQEKLRDANETLPSQRRVRFRMGVHLGDIMVKGGDLFGHGVNIAARLQVLAEPGTVCLSGDVHRHVRNALPLTYEDLGPQQVKLIADRDQLHQVIVNLVVNAHQALDEKRGTDRRIRLRAARAAVGDAIEISVSDNGPGIPPAIRSRIFEPFFSTKPQGFGTGIGLAISRGLVETHGGTLELGHGKEPGATFLIRLPVAPTEQSAGEPGSDKAVPARQPILSRGTVLVVDDEKDIVDLLTDMLRQLDFNVVGTHSGKAAVAMLAAITTPPDAIICDIRMPDGDGPFLHDWLEANRPELVSRVVFLTGDSLGPSASRFLARSKSASLEKPFSRADIAAMLENLMSHGRVG